MLECNRFSQGGAMISVELPADIEQQFRDVVQKSYHGNIREAFASFLKLHNKYGWKEQLIDDVESIRTEVQKRGGINAKTINDAISKYRKGIGTFNG
jgi:hypothetical protein